MDFSHYTDNAVAMAEDLVNTLGLVDGADRLDHLDGLRELLARYEDEWHDADRHPGTPTAADLEEVRELRDRLRRVFEAETAEDAAHTLNRILADVVATPRVSLENAAPHLHFEPVEGRIAQWLGAAAAMGLATVLVHHGIERFGVCVAGDCVDAYVDTSKNRSRRHCSTTCSNREHVAAHRARQREGTQAAS